MDHDNCQILGQTNLKHSNKLNHQKVFPDNQHGFRTGRSCTTLLLKTFDDWTAILDKTSGTHIHTVFLDWAKAFDKVPHERLLSKLKHYGIKGYLLSWYKNFLTGSAGPIENFQYLLLFDFRDCS
jgi:Reverse transcriptase (RNA-dependent DNA polymerase)